MKTFNKTSGNIIAITINNYGSQITTRLTMTIGKFQSFISTT